MKKFEEEIVDRFGKIPIELQLLIQITRLKIISYLNTITSIKGNEEKIIITFDYSLSDMKDYINKKVKGNFSIGFKQIIFIPFYILCFLTNERMSLVYATASLFFVMIYFSKFVKKF